MRTQKLITNISKLVSIPSDVGQPDALRDAVQFIADMLAANPKITVERFEKNGRPSLLAYYAKTRPKRFDVLFQGHVDVVPAPDDQFKPFVEEGRLYGRGVYDMKAAAVTMAEIFRTKGEKSPLSLGLQIVSDEETGGYDGVVEQVRKGVAADFVITGEMTDNLICNETRGMCWAEVSFSGKTAHGAYVWDGENALSKASDLAQRVLDRYPTPREISWQTTVNIAAISTDNETYNKVPAKASVKIDFRFIPEDKIFRSKDTVRSFLEELSPGCEVDFKCFEPAVCVDEAHPYLRQFRGAFKTANGTPPKLIRRYGSSDARHFALAGMDCIEFGPAGGNLHADNEFLILESLEPFISTLEEFISRPKPSQD